MKDSADVQLLRETPGFRDLEPALLESLLAKAANRKVGAGDTLFQAAQPFLDEVYIVRRGEIELQRSDGCSSKATPDHLLGLSSYLGESPYASSATALEDTELLVLPASSAVGW